MFFIHNYTRTLSAFPCGRTQHVRRMRSSIVKRKFARLIAQSRDIFFLIFRKAQPSFFRVLRKAVPSEMLEKIYPYTV